MKIRVLTLFPDTVDEVMQHSMVGRALQEGQVDYASINIRDFAVNRYGRVDDTLYGGGTGMLMMCDPVYEAWEKARSDFPEQGKVKTLYLSPKGKVFDQAKALELSKEENLIFLCGHYEGVDQRVLDEIVDEEISLGDFVLTGGELAALTVIDAVVRLLPGVLPSEEAYLEDSHMNYALEHPQYTKPAVWKNKAVPEVLLSGHHENIRRWKKTMSLYETMKKRPDLYEKAEVGEEDLLALLELLKENHGSGSLS